MDRTERGLRAAVAVAGLLPVAALLAWVTGLGPFHVWFLATGVPALVVLVGLAALAAHRADRFPTLRRAMVAGALGGLVGTIGYDLFRIPFIIGGLRLFAPLDSYGMLLADAATSSPLTGFLGWSFHLTNGIGFGLAYAMVALGRRARWAVVWGFFLETVTVVTPFADVYGLRGKWGLIGIAYAAHVAYGLPLGVLVRRAASWPLRRTVLVPAGVLVAAAYAVLALWLQPWSGAGRTERPVTRIVDGRFSPEWVRVAPGPAGCARVENTDEADYDLVPAGGVAQLCAKGKGARRVQLDRRPYSGGFVLSDPEA